MAGYVGKRNASKSETENWTNFYRVKNIAKQICEIQKTPKFQMPHSVNFNVRKWVIPKGLSDLLAGEWCYTFLIWVVLGKSNAHGWPNVTKGTLIFEKISQKEAESAMINGICIENTNDNLYIEGALNHPKKLKMISCRYTWAPARGKLLIAKGC